MPLETTKPVGNISRKKLNREDRSMTSSLATDRVESIHRCRVGTTDMVVGGWGCLQVTSKDTNESS